MVDTGNARQLFRDGGTQRFLLRAHFDVIPVAHHGDLFVEGAQGITDVTGQNFDKAQAHRLTFDGDFREELDDKLHGDTASLGK